MNKNFKILICALIGTVLSYFLNVTLGLNSVLAAGIVGLLGAFFLPKGLDVVFYTASFAGMSSSAVLANYLMVALSGLLVGVIFMLAANVFNGYGGKLGTIAALSVLIISGIFGLF